MRTMNKKDLRALLEDVVNEMGIRDTLRALAEVARSKRLGYIASRLDDIVLSCQSELSKKMGDK